MDSLEIEGKEYISAKRAAREHSYTMDYIGQLIRGGKLVGKKVGRAWYVEQESLNSYIATLLKAGSLPVPENQGDERSETTTLAPHENEQKDEQKVQEEKVEPVAQEEKQPPPILAAEDITTRPTYNYPMLNYVHEDEKEVELIPELGTKDEQPIVLRKEYTTEAIATQAEEQAPRAWQHAESRDTGREALGARAPRFKVKRPVLLPALVGAALVLIVVVATSFATFFIKTIHYEEATASVTQSIEYKSFSK